MEKQLEPINLYTFNGRSYCDMLDVLRMIHAELDNCPDNPECIARRILRRMEARVILNAMWKKRG